MHRKWLTLALLLGLIVPMFAAGANRAGAQEAWDVGTYDTTVCLGAQVEDAWLVGIQSVGGFGSQMGDAMFLAMPEKDQKCLLNYIQYGLIVVESTSEQLGIPNPGNDDGMAYAAEEYPYCGSYVKTLTKKTISGKWIAFQVEARKSFCWNSTRITAGTFSLKYKNLNSMRIDNNWGGAGVQFYKESEWLTDGKIRLNYGQGHLTNCVIKYGCGADFYPWMQAISSAGGRVAWSGGF